MCYKKRVEDKSITFSWGDPNASVAIAPKRHEPNIKSTVSFSPITWTSLSTGNSHGSKESYCPSLCEHVWLFILILSCHVQSSNNASKFHLWSIPGCNVFRRMCSVLQKTCHALPPSSHRRYLRCVPGYRCSVNNRKSEGWNDGGRRPPLTLEKS